MKRSLQEVVELVVFGLVALLLGTALLWVLGWVLSLGGALFKALAGLLWLLLRFIVPIAIVAGLVYFLVKALQGRGSEAAASTSGPGTGTAAAGGVQGTVERVREAASDAVAKAKDAASGVSQRVARPADGPPEAVTPEVDPIVDVPPADVVPPVADGLEPRTADTASVDAYPDGVTAEDVAPDDVGAGAPEGGAVEPGSSTDEAGRASDEDEV